METIATDDPSTSDWAVKSVIQEVGEPMDALCTNKAFDLLTVAGRSVMKVKFIAFK
jgi:hypothetical protein